MRIAVVGAGAIGCYLGVRLRERGHAVTLIGRAPQVAAIARAGLTVRDSRGRTRRHDLPAATALTERPDLVLLTVKTQDVTSACEAIHPYVSGVSVVAMQNGMRGDGLAASVLDSATVLGAVVICAATYLQPGAISVEFPGWLVLGEPFGPLGQRAHGIREVLGQAVPTYLTRHLQQVRWSKLLANLNNGLSAATGLPFTDLLDTPVVRRLPVLTMREGYRVVRAAGIRLDHGLYGLSSLRTGHREVAVVALMQAALPTVLATLPVRGATGFLDLARRGRLSAMGIRGSTWQSLARGRPTEIAYLNGEIVRLGRRHGIPTPINEHLVELVREVERTGVFFPPEALRPPAIEAVFGPAGGRP